MEIIMNKHKLTSPYGLPTDVVYWHGSYQHRGFYVQTAQDTEQGAANEGKWKAFAREENIKGEITDFETDWVSTYVQARNEIQRYIDIYRRTR